MGKRDDFIKLNRGITDHWLWETKPFSPGQAWIDLLLMAAWKTAPREWKGSFVIQHRGDVLTTLKTLADRWGWSEKKVRRFLGVLEQDGMLTKKGQAKGTILTIENYTKFQGRGRTDDRAEGRAAGEQRPTIEEGIKKGKETRARGDLEDPAAALEEVEATEAPDWFIEKVKNTFGKM